jgi:CheY-like chemotaxis protein
LSSIVGVGAQLLDNPNILHGRTVLIVEDEPLIALELREVLGEEGVSVFAATSSKKAIELIAAADISAAIVDVGLGVEDCSVVCHALDRRSIPFMFYTGNSAAAPLRAWPSVPTIIKPGTAAAIIAALTRLTAHN